MTKYSLRHSPQILLAGIFTLQQKTGDQQRQQSVSFEMMPLFPVCVFLIEEPGILTDAGYMFLVNIEGLMVITPTITGTIIK